MNTNRHEPTHPPNRKKALVNLARAILIFANLLAMPYYIHLSQLFLERRGFEATTMRHVGILSSIVSAAAWLVSWRVGLGLQIVVFVLWAIA
jgi:hypothetical protein